MPIISENISYISVEDLVIRDQYGTPTAYNLWGKIWENERLTFSIFGKKNKKGKLEKF